MTNGNYNKWFLIYLTIFIVAFLILMPYITLDPDTGTHSLLSLFYRNLIDSVVKNGEISFQKIYDFGISYLVHYPKLQVFYPPLYHLVTGLIFYTIFGISAWAGGFCNLVFAVLSMCTLYVFVTKIFNSKTALIAVVLFSLFPYMLTLTGRPMMEYTAMFFLFLSLLIYSEIKNSNKKRYYVLLAVTAVLSVLSKRAAFFILPVYFLHLLYKKKWKEVLIFSVVSVILLAPYGIIVWKVNGLEISSVIWGRYAFEGVVNSLTFSLEFPFLIVFLGAFFFYLYRSKDKNKVLLGIWFLIFLLGVLSISVKPRYFIYFLIPTFIVAANYLSKRHKFWILLFFISYFIFSVYVMMPTLISYDIELVSREIYDNAVSGSSVAMISEGNYFYSSDLMFYLDKFDAESEVKKNLFVYRSCAFFGKDTNDIIESFENDNVFYVVAISGEMGYDSLDGVKSMLIQTRGGYVELYKVKNFEWNERTEYCNTVCLTEEKICTEFKTPIKVFANT